MSRWLALVVLLLPRVALGEGPASLEGTAWLGVGGGYRLVGNKLFEVGEVSAGAEMTAQLATFEPTQQYGGAYELRVGPWAAVALASREALVEGGFKLSLGQVSHARWGTFDIRVGVGAGSFESPWTEHIVVTGTGGVRSFPDRYRGSSPTVLAFGSVLRLFLTTRIRQSSPSPWEVTAGLELEPSFLAPPYSWQRLAGARY